MKISTKNTEVLSFYKPKAVYAASKQQYATSGREVHEPWSVNYE